jgi:chaperonin GroEL
MKNIKLGETKELIKNGVDKLADVVKITLGGKGKNVIINNGMSNVQIINDGVSIAREVELEDEIENTGATLAKQAAEKTNNEAGDATTTTIVLLQEFLNEMMKIKTKDVRGLRDDINIELAKVIAELDKRKIELKDEDIFRIAKNSSLDDEIATAITETIKKIGKDGLVSIEDSTYQEIKSEIVTGIKIDDGYLNPYMWTNFTKRHSELFDPYIIVSKKRIGEIRELLPLIVELQREKGAQLVIFTSELSDEVAEFLTRNKVEGIFTTLVVKTKNVEDIAVVTGAEIVDEINKKVARDILGKAGKVVATQYNTVVIDGKAPKEDVDEKIEELKGQLESVEEGYEANIVRERIAKLRGGVAILKIGGSNEQETKEKKLKLEDALNAVRSAMDEGIIIGGGMSLKQIAMRMNNVNEAEFLIKSVIEAPFYQIIKNAEEDGEEVMLNSPTLDDNMGYNVITRQWENFYESGIIDPVKAVKCALKNAFAMGIQIMTAEASIITKK